MGVIQANGGHWWTGSCDPDETDHLARGARHELTRLAGEDGPPMDGWGCNYNIMANGEPWWCRWGWRAPSTITKVQSFAWPRIH